MAKDIRPRFAAFGLNDVIAEILQDLGGIDADEGIVFYEQQLQLSGSLGMSWISGF